MPVEEPAPAAYRIRGQVRQLPSLPPLATQFVRHAEGGVRRLLPRLARDGAADEISVAADSLVRVELENGFVLWSRADQLLHDHGQLTLTRDGSAAWQFDQIKLAPRTVARERGALGLAIRALDFFGVELDQRAAAGLAQWFESKQLGGRAPGLYRCLHEKNALALAPVPAAEFLDAAAGPMLVLLHGTASSTLGSFGELWRADNREGARLIAQCQQRYGARMLAWEHRSLSESPIRNALALAQRLPSGAELHLLSHSRGGLIGELLCLAGCDKLAEVLNADTLAQCFAADRTVAAQLGLDPLDAEAAAARDAAYAQDRAELAQLLDLLAQRRFRIRRFVRVACPARGTTLASGRLDRWLSALDFLVSQADGLGLFADGLDFLLAVVKERTDPRTLPGLEAMMPGSALTRLLHHPELSTQADLAVIAGDIEGESLWQRVKLVLSDWFYGADHDLVVNTSSMSGGLARSGRGARWRLDRGAEVSHFRYFSNPRSVAWVAAALGRADGDDAGFLPLAQAPQQAPRWRSALARSQSASTPRPLAVLLPGVMGSELALAGESIWLNYWALLRGGLAKLNIDAAEVSPQGVVDQHYGQLLEFLAHTHRVHYFSYDWRRSVREAAARLVTALEPWVEQAEREGQPVHLVAHSMGGLVVRAMIADAGAGAAIWQRIRRLPGSRLLMLGTPNFGSWESLRWLTGNNATQAKLALLDLTQSTDDLIDLVRDYPGLVELLPCAASDPDFSQPALWHSLQQQTGARWQAARDTTLSAARQTWTLLRGAAPDPELMRYVAGSQPTTVVGYRLASAKASVQNLQFDASAEGDGTVPWASGSLPEVPMYYLEDVAHDALCASPRAFPAYLDLLVSGSTRRLPNTPPQQARSFAAAQVFPLPALPPLDSIPAPEALHELGFGGGFAAQDQALADPATRIEISLRHGDLSYARHPVVVGHYLGDTIVSAEAILDRQLDGALLRRLELDIYPGRIDSHALFFNEKPGAKPSGAIVIGLGQVGELSPGLLEAGARAAFLNYALQVARWPDERFGRVGQTRSAALSCLLVGSGAGGFTARESLEALLRAANAANARLAQTELAGSVQIDRIEFIELFEDLALGAAAALRRLLDETELGRSVHWPASAIQCGAGGRRRLRFGEAPEWWHRVEIIADSERPDLLRFIFPTDRARAEETLCTGQLALAETFIKQASASPSSNVEAARTLFEMLLPLRLKELAPQQGDLVLLVDERSARYPWELLENRWSDSARPPAVVAGLIRQLKTPVFRARPAHAFAATAFVVGNPDLGGLAQFPELPGARQEAQRVQALLGAAGFAVRDCIDEGAASVLEGLHREAWRILHLAGHGVHQYLAPDAAAGSKPASGMVIGPNVLLTPGDIEQMRWVPELVFINCCHLGRGERSTALDRGELAANLGLHFVRMGVRAVIAAGWAVDDAAGLLFAESFYAAMLQGDSFGEAVRVAREAVWERVPGVNTWGAYQCYGDPGYRLQRNGGVRDGEAKPFMLAGELVVELENFARSLQAGANAAEPGASLDALCARIPPNLRQAWLARADVAAGLGFAWGEARAWAKAIEWLERALGAAQGECPLRAVEQCANYRVRLAAETWQNARSQGLRPATRELLARVRQGAGELDLLCQRGATPERLSLLGAAWKRIALLETRTPARQTALLHMRDAYQRACELACQLDGQAPVYAQLNALAAPLLLAQGQRAAPLAAMPAAEPSLAALRQSLARLATQLHERQAEDADFWTEVALGDLATLEAILPGSSSADIEAALQRAAARYRCAIQRGASPRQLASVRDNLRFIAALLPSTQAQHSAILALAQALESGETAS